MRYNYSKTFENSNVEIIVNNKDAVIVDVHPNTDSWWGPCRLVFTGRYIMCCGDVHSYTLNCTWDTADKIRNGVIYDERYLLSKLEHRQQLRQFESELFDAKMKEIKEYYLEGLETKEEKEEFLEVWEEKEYLLQEVDGHRLENVDEFFDLVGVEDGWEYYESFFDYEAHAYAFIELINVVAKYFREEKEGEEGNYDDTVC